jgi:hypothetical protein
MFIVERRTAAVLAALGAAATLALFSGASDPAAEPEVQPSTVSTESLVRSAGPGIEANAPDGDGAPGAASDDGRLVRYGR